MKKLTLAVLCFAGVIAAVQAEDAKPAQSKDQPACCTMGKTCGETTDCCSDKAKHVAKNSTAKQQVLLSPKAISLASK